MENNLITVPSANEYLNKNQEISVGTSMDKKTLGPSDQTRTVPIHFHNGFDSDKISFADVVGVPIVAKGDLFVFGTKTDKLALGTNGQYLTVNTSTYTGLEWATLPAIPSVPLTTKGDLLGFSTVNARVPVGTNGQVLTADSTQTLGVKWETPASSSVNFYGDGSDGSVVFDGSSVVLGITPSSGEYVFTRDIYCVNITVNAGVSIKTNGYRIYHQGTFTHNGDWFFDGVDGGHASGTTGGSAAAGAPTGTLFGSNPGKAGANGTTGSSSGAAAFGVAGTAGTASNNRLYGPGAAGGDGGKGGFYNVPPNGAGGAKGNAGGGTQSVTVPSVLVFGLFFGDFNGQYKHVGGAGSGGGGGGGTYPGSGSDVGNGGGGGGSASSAGIAWSCGKTFTGNGNIYGRGGTGGNGANGTNGNNDGGGGGGGGGGGDGGLHVSVCETYSFTGTIDLTRGLGGTGGLKGTGSTGTGPSDGSNGEDGINGTHLTVLII